MFDVGFQFFNLFKKSILPDKEGEKPTFINAKGCRPHQVGEYIFQEIESLLCALAVENRKLLL